MARKALLVGINRYPDPENRLNGCVNDVRQVRALLQQHYGFDRPSAFDILLDAQATTAAIRAALGRLVAGARPGDLLVFHYSGHGSQVPDRDGDETADGLDEIICPYDLDWRHPIKDDDLYWRALTNNLRFLLCVPVMIAISIALPTRPIGTSPRLGDAPRHPLVVRFPVAWP